MNVSGKDFINAIANKRKQEGKINDDSGIVNEIRKLSWQQINEIILMGKYQKTEDVI